LSPKSDITVLIAPLDWGLGHATRCIPLINHLLQIGCKVIIAAEGIQKELLKTEFPNVIFVNIPAYDIHYTNVKRFFALKIALQVPKILTAIYAEKKWLDRFLKNSKVDVIISDNRFGLYDHKVTSVFITHQLLIKAYTPYVEKVLLKINNWFIKKFSLCWIPDEKGARNLAGVLSHPPILPRIKVEYMGGLSRLERQKQNLEKYKILIVLSGPEPQRTSLEMIIINELKDFKQKAMLVRGLPGSTGLLSCGNDVIIKNHLPARDLEKFMNESEYIISRSGYTTVMDICKLQKKSILIPTPGQTEQEYLAHHLQLQGWCVAAKQENFSLEKSLQKAQHFEYKLPDLNMEAYKETLDGLISGLVLAKKNN
jgi:uncharacterized protein (TIGR00661 family)